MADAYKSYGLRADGTAVPIGGSSQTNPVVPAGGVVSVNTVLPDENGNITLTHENVGALSASGTAVNAQDAQKLGDKPPEYYLPAVNLLDNSDFEIAQAGYNGLHGSTRYCADAWPTLFGAAATLVKNDGYITLETTANYRYMHQPKLVSELTENAYTFSVKKRGNKTTTMRLICAKGTETAQIKTAWISAGSEWNTGILTFARDEIAAYDTVWFAITNEEAGSVDYKEPVLYPGTYTAENLPPFALPDPTLELAKCQRYFVAYHSYGDYGLAFGTGSMFSNNVGRIAVQLPAPMREKPTFGAVNVQPEKIAIDVDGQRIYNPTMTVLCQSGSKIIFQIQLPSNSVTKYGIFALSFSGIANESGYLYFSADL